MAGRLAQALAAILAIAPAAAPSGPFDVVIRGDRIEAVGDLSRSKARTVIDAKGLAVAPGFINMLSWATESLWAFPGMAES